MSQRMGSFIFIKTFKLQRIIYAFFFGRGMSHLLLQGVHLDRMLEYLHEKLLV